MTDTPRPRFPYPSTEPVEAPPTDADLNAEWEASDLADKWRWRDVYEGVFSGMGRATYLARAERLSGYGFGPDALSRVCGNPREVAALPDPDVRSEDNAEAFSALAHEAALFYSGAYSLARQMELGYARRLIDVGWSQTQVASLLGVTKQRMSALLKQERTVFGKFENRPRGRKEQ